MIRQARIAVTVEETDAAVTGLGGVPALVNLAHAMGLLKDVDALLPPKERRQGDLFEGTYVYAAVITNRDLPLEALVAWHRQRCNCENHIKELKHGFGLHSLPSADCFVKAVDPSPKTPPQKTPRPKNRPLIRRFGAIGP